MGRKTKESESNELRPEYDFSKMKLVGRGIFAEQYRGAKVILLDNDDVADEEQIESYSETQPIEVETPGADYEEKRDR